MNHFVNIHCHLINFHFIPDKFFKTRGFSSIETLLKMPFTLLLARFIALITRYKKLHEAILLYQQDIATVAEQFIQEMDAAKILCAIPLMMDLEYASFRQKPEVPYRHQIELIAQVAAKYPGRLFPFVMVDPRRPNAAKTTIRALKDLGFLGVKMYPPLGYHPYHNSFYNEDMINRELHTIYDYCQTYHVPITVHCSRGGAYSAEVMKCLELREELTKPSNWRSVLNDFPNLHLNLAHFGGDFDRIKTPNSWASEIVTMLKEYEFLYTDLAYHDYALKKGTPYFELLSQILQDPSLHRKILFGTDWPMTRHTWTEQDYITPFINTLGEETMNLIAGSNCVRFLFPEARIPLRVVKGLAKRGTEIPQALRLQYQNLGIETPGTSLP